LNSILENLSDQLPSIKKLSNNSQNYLLKDLYEEQIQTYLPTVPNTLSAYLPGGTSYDLPNTLFHFYNTGVYVYCPLPIFAPIFHIEKTQQYVRIGDFVNNIRIVYVGGETYSLASTKNIEIRTGAN
jgi:hypothetical protein